MIVTDASVLTSALIDPGRDGDVARARLAGEDLVAPELLDLEVLSAVRGLVRGGRIAPATAVRALELLGSMPIARESHRPLLSRCWELRHNLTAYDASYVALAELLRVPLVTTDARIGHVSGLRCVIEILA